MIDGEPLTKGYIRFVPSDARSVGSRIDAEGRFYFTGEGGPDDGLPPGKHRIEVAASEPIDDVSMKWFAPKKYADFRTSGLEQTIDTPTDSLMIELTWGDQEGPFVESLDVPMEPNGSVEPNGEETESDRASDPEPSAEAADGTDPVEDKTEGSVEDE